MGVLVGDGGIYVGTFDGFEVMASRGMAVRVDIEVGRVDIEVISVDIEVVGVNVTVDVLVAKVVSRCSIVVVNVFLFEGVQVNMLDM